MNPYEILQYLHPIDLFMVWAGVVGWLIVGSGLIGKSHRINPIGAENICAAVAWAFLALVAAITAVLGLGLVLFVWLRFRPMEVSILWRHFAGISIVCIFKVLPFIASGLICWALVGRWRASFSWRSLMLAAAGVVGLVADAALYYWITGAVRHDGY